MPYMIKPGLTDTPILIADNRVGEAQQLGWQMAGDPSSGSMSVDPSLPYYQWLVQQQLAGINAGIAQQGANTSAFSAQASAANNAYANQTGRLGTAAQLFYQMRDPANIYQTQALLAGDPRPGIAPAMAAVGNLIGGLQNAYADPRQYRPMDWNLSGFGKLFGSGVGAGYGGPGGGGHGDGGGGGSDIAWKQKLEAAGIKVGDANPDQKRAAKRGHVSSSQLVAMQDGRYGDSNRALPYEQAVADPNARGAQPGSGGAPPGVRVTNGHPQDDTSGDSTPRNDNGTPYTGPLDTPMSRVRQGAAGPADSGTTPEQQPGIARAPADYTQQAQDQLAKSAAAGFPAPAPGQALPVTPAGPAAQPTAADFGSFYSSNPTMHAASQYGNPANSISYGDDRLGHVTRVVYAANADGTKPPDRYFLDDGTQVQHNPAANSPGAGLWVSGGPPATGTVPATPSGTVQTTTPEGVHIDAAAPTLPAPPPQQQVNTGAASRDSSAIPQQSISTGAGSRDSSAFNSNRDQGTINGRDQSTYGGDKSDAEKAADRARKKEEERAMGGTDVLRQGYVPPVSGPVATGHSPEGYPYVWPPGWYIPLPSGQQPEPPVWEDEYGTFPTRSTPRGTVQPVFGPGAGGGMSSNPDGPNPLTMPVMPGTMYPIISNAMGGTSLVPMGESQDPSMQDDQSGQDTSAADDTSGGPKLMCVPDGPNTCTVIDLATGDVLGQKVPESRLAPLVQAGVAVMHGGSQGGGAAASLPPGMMGGGGASPGAPPPSDQGPPMAMAGGGSVLPGAPVPITSPQAQKAQGGPKLLCIPDGPGTCTVLDLQTNRTLATHVPESQLQPLIDSGEAIKAPGYQGDGGASDLTTGGPPAQDPAAMAGGGSLQVMRHPFRFSVMGQPFLVGEPNRQHPDGADEIVSVAPGPSGGMAVTTLPLQNPQRPVTRQIAALANALVPGSPYHATSDIQGLPAYARGYQYHQPVLRADGGIDLIPMAAGGVQTTQPMPVYGGQGPQPLTSGALTPSFKPFKLTHDEKRLGLYPEGKFVSDSGQVQAPTGHGGFKTMPQFRTFPQTDESEVLTQVAQQIQDDPVLFNSVNSALSAAGRLPASYWARINAFRAPQQAPSVFASRNGF